MCHDLLLDKGRPRPSLLQSHLAVDAERALAHKGKDPAARWDDADKRWDDYISRFRDMQTISRALRHELRTSWAGTSTFCLSAVVPYPGPEFKRCIYVPLRADECSTSCVGRARCVAQLATAIHNRLRALLGRLGS